MAKVYIGIGSNIGDRKANCSKAIEYLKSKGITVTKVSSMFETEPWGVKDQEKFINMAIEAETGLSPEELLSVMKDIEHLMGRVETVRWGPRIIDLDILFYDDMVVNREGLQIPHPLLHKRDFVLGPLSEIAPDKTHPVLMKSVSRLREELKNGQDA